MTGAGRTNGCGLSGGLDRDRLTLEISSGVRYRVVSKRQRVAPDGSAVATPKAVIGLTT